MEIFIVHIMQLSVYLEIGSSAIKVLAKMDWGGNATI